MRKISISKAGQCARRWGWEWLGKGPLKSIGTTPEYLALAAREGERHEQWIRQDLITETGYEDVLQSSSCPRGCERDGLHVELGTERFLFVGHIDGFLVRDGRSRVGEYKALGFRNFSKLDRLGVNSHRTYHTQVSLYYWALQDVMEGALWCLKSRNSGVLRVTWMPEDVEFLGLPEIYGRLAGIEDAVSRGELPPCDVVGDVDKWGCTPLCGIDDYDDREPEMQVKEAAIRYRMAVEMEKEAKGAKASARHILESWADGTESNSTTVETPEGGVRISKVKEGWRSKVELPDEVKKEFTVRVPRGAYKRISILD